MIKLNKIKLYNVFILSIIFITISNIFVYADTSTNLDLSDNKIIGNESKYYFQIPVSWQNYIYAKRNYFNTDDYFDKIDFYYKHKDDENKDIRFFSLYAYELNKYKDSINQDIVLVTDDYIFTSTTYLNNPYFSVNDKIIFSRFIKELSSSTFLSDKIFVTTDRPNSIQTGVLTVNNQVSLKDAVIENGHIYLPLRETCQKLGYSVTWISTDKTILISKFDNSITIPVSNTRHKNIDNTIYLPIQLFIQNIHFDIDIDSKNNITIRG